VLATLIAHYRIYKSINTKNTECKSKNLDRLADYHTLQHICHGRYILHNLVHIIYALHFTQRLLHILHQAPTRSLTLTQTLSLILTLPLYLTLYFLTMLWNSLWRATTFANLASILKLSLDHMTSLRYSDNSQSDCVVHMRYLLHCTKRVCI